MSYLSQSALAVFDQYFRARIAMCVVEQAKIFTNDERAEYNLLADQALANYQAVTDKFVPLVATQPAMNSDSTDGDLLAAVQGLWPVLGAPLVPPPPPQSTPPPI